MQNDSRLQIRWALVLLVVFTLVGGIKISMATEVSGPITIRIDGSDPISVLSWRFGISKPEAHPSVPYATPEASPLVITRRMDGESEHLLVASVDLGTIDELELIQGDLKIVLEDSVVVNYQVDGASYGNEKAAEVITLLYGVIQIHFLDTSYEFIYDFISPPP